MREWQKLIEYWKRNEVIQAYTVGYLSITFAMNGSQINIRQQLDSQEAEREKYSQRKDWMPASFWTLETQLFSDGPLLSPWGCLFWWLSAIRKRGQQRGKKMGGQKRWGRNWKRQMKTKRETGRTCNVFLHSGYQCLAGSQIGLSVFPLPLI